MSGIKTLARDLILAFPSRTGDLSKGIVMKKVILAAAFAALAGCVQNVVEMQTPFDPNAGAYVLARGTGTITGQAFMRQAGGGVVTCAGETVNLVPATTYHQERIRIIYGTTDGGSRTTGIGDVPPPLAPGAEKLLRTTLCDADGNFEFTGVAAGDYYVTSRVEWMAGDYSQGGVLAKRLNLGSGQKTRVLLN